jgi:hypothetical protein
MKTSAINWMVVATLVLAGSQRAFSQGFVNLDFESAMVSGYSPQSTIPAALAFPGWMVSPAPPFYGGISLGGALVSVHEAFARFSAAHGQSCFAASVPV